MKKNKDNRSEKVEKYYDLKTKAVDDLVTADKDNVPEYSEAELKKYRSRSGIRIPQWLKIIFIKAWFYGAVCFFFFWGLANYISYLDLLFVIGFASGVVTDLLINNVLRFMAENPGDHDRWMMFPKKRTVNLFLNILYGYVLLICVFYLYNLIGVVLNRLFGVQAGYPFGVEPVFFGIFFMAFDMLFIGIKKAFQKIFQDAKNSVNGQKGNKEGKSE